MSSWLRCKKPKRLPMLVPESTIATRSALDTYGDYEQAQIAIEELAELVVALKHYERSRIDKLVVCNEIADVCIVLAQLVDAFGREDVVRLTEEKQKRLMERLLLRDTHNSAL